MIIMTKMIVVMNLSAFCNSSHAICGLIKLQELATQQPEIPNKSLMSPTHPFPLPKFPLTTMARPVHKYHLSKASKQQQGGFPKRQGDNIFEIQKQVRNLQNDN